MKRRLLLLTGFCLLTLIASGLLPQSVAQGRRLASINAGFSSLGRTTAPAAIPAAAEIRIIPLRYFPAETVQSDLLPVVLQPDIREEDQRLADEILRMIPSHCIGRLHNFYVRYDDSLPSRGLAGPTTVIVNGNLPVGEKRAVLIHEALGHFMDLGCLTGTPRSGLSAFRDGNQPIYKDDPSVEFYSISWQDEKTLRPDANPRTDCASRYGCTSDCFEDMADFVTRMFTDEKGLRTLARTNAVIARKIAWVETHILTDPALVLAVGAYRTPEKTPWDATKLPYRWLGKTL